MSMVSLRSVPVRKVLIYTLLVACLYGGADIVIRTLSLWKQQTYLPCTPDDEGQWSLGIFKGPSPFRMQPPELWPQTQGASGSKRTENPVVTCVHMAGTTPSSFVADPFLWPQGDSLYMLFETKSLHNMQGDIGAAVSVDGGRSFKGLGVVLDEPWHLSYPFVFEHGGEVYMLPESSKSRTLRLYKAKEFPIHWVLDKVLIDGPIVDASVITPEVAAAAGLGGEKWYMFASDQRRKSSKRCRELELWHSDSLHGVWELHPASPVREWVQGSRMGGRPVVVDGKLYRFGQDCTKTYGHRLKVYEVVTMNVTHYLEREVPQGLGWDPMGGVQGVTQWNGERYHHMDAHMLPTGEWVAAMDGDRYVSDYLSWQARYRVAWLLLPALVVAWISMKMWGKSKQSNPISGILKAGKENV